MKRKLLLALALALLVCTASAMLVPRAGSGSRTGEVFRKIPGEYIVVLRPDADIDAHLSRVSATANITRVLHRYQIGADFLGYAAQMDARSAELLAATAGVRYVEQNEEVHSMAAKANCVRMSGPDRVGSWGLTRTIKRTRGLTALDEYQMLDNAGEGVTVFILDTGIDTTHPLFEGRATFGYDSTGEGPGDGNGHGTHCAGTVGSERFGLARKAQLVAVKVLDSGGSGSFAGVIAGIDFVASHRAPRRVVNLSLGGQTHQATNEALDAMVRSGVFAAVAAGNDGYYPPLVGDSCDYSPGGAEQAFTVASMVTIGEMSWRSRFSNWGKCVDIYAPGESIMSTWLDHGSYSAAGTSMAAPHVAGVAAKLWSSEPRLSVPQLKERLVRLSTQDVIEDSTKELGSPNKLLYADCTSF